MKKVFTLNTITPVVEEIISHIFSLRQKSNATIISLSGDLGAGKTTLTQCLLKTLGVTEVVQSPTYVILKKYKTENDILKTVIHIDAYRLQSETELQKLYWEEYVSNPENLIIIEWPEIVLEIIPEHSIQIKLNHISETEREIEF